MKVDCGICPLCGTPTILLLPDDLAGKVATWNTNGRPTLVQYEFPMLTVDQREMLISSTHPRCFDRAFAE